MHRVAVLPVAVTIALGLLTACGSGRSADGSGRESDRVPVLGSTEPATSLTDWPMPGRPKRESKA